LTGTTFGTTATTQLRGASAAITNASITSLTLSRVSNGLIINKQNSVFEGGEFVLEIANSSTLSGNVVVDINGNTFRIFENGGTFRGVTLDLSNQGSQSTLLTSTNYTANITTLAVTSGTITTLKSTSATIDNLKSTSADITTLTSTSATITTVVSPAVLNSNGIVFNKNSSGITYAFPTDYNGFSVSPYTTLAGASITLTAGSRWIVM
jgi:hypothetical protein